MANRTVHVNMKAPAFPFGAEYAADNSGPVIEERYPSEGLAQVLSMRNALPTSYGYTSFFGETPLNGNLALPFCTEKAFTYKDSIGNNTLIGLGSYGIVYSTDGVTWNKSQATGLPTPLPAGYTLSHGANNAWQTYINVSMSASISPILAGADAVPVANQAVGTGIVNLTPYSGTQAFNPITVPMGYQQELQFDPNVITIAPNIKATAGSTYILQSEDYYGSYTATATDTVSTILTALIANYNLGGTMVATLTAAGNIEVTGTTNFFPFLHLYEMPQTAPTGGTLLGTITATAAEQRLYVSPNSMGNLGYVIFRNATGAPLTTGSVRLYKYGRNFSGYLNSYVAGASSTPFGTMGFTALNAAFNQPLLLPLDSEWWQLSPTAGALPAGVSVEIYDTGIPLGSTYLGTPKVQMPGVFGTDGVRIGATPAEAIAGRVYAIKQGTTQNAYTLTAADNSPQAIATATAAVLGNTAVDKFVQGNGADILHIHPLPTVATANAATIAFSRWASGVSTYSTNIPAVNRYTYMGLSAAFTVAPANVRYRVYVDGLLMPLLGTAGFLSDSNGYITAAQLTAGTLIMFPAFGVRFEIVPEPDPNAVGAPVYGNVTINCYTLVSAPQVTADVWANAASASLVSITGTTTAELFVSDNIRNSYKQPLAIAGYESLYSPLMVRQATVPYTVPVGTTASLPTTTVITTSVPMNDLGEVDFTLLADPTVVGGVVTALAITPTDPATAAPLPVINGTIQAGGASYKGTIGLPATSLTNVNTVSLWHVAVVQNTLYAFRQGEAGIYVYDPLAMTWAIHTAASAVNPLLFANIPQMVGICEGRGRVIAWDTTDSIYIGPNTRTATLDFTPSVATGADVLKVAALKGKIVTILPFTEGFIIYATASIIRAVYDGTSYVFRYVALSSTNGINDAYAVTVADDNLHYAMTDLGLVAVTSQGLKDISQQASDQIKASNVQPRLEYVANRYLSIGYSPQQPSNASSQTQTYTGAQIPGFASITLPINMLPGIRNTGDFTSYGALQYNMVNTIEIPDFWFEVRAWSSRANYAITQRVLVRGGTFHSVAEFRQWLTQPMSLQLWAPTVPAHYATQPSNNIGMYTFAGHELYSIPGLTYGPGIRIVNPRNSYSFEDAANNVHIPGHTYIGVNAALASAFHKITVQEAFQGAISNATTGLGVTRYSPWKAYFDANALPRVTYRPITFPVGKDNILFALNWIVLADIMSAEAESMLSSYKPWQMIAEASNYSWYANPATGAVTLIQGVTSLREAQPFGNGLLSTDYLATANDFNTWPGPYPAGTTQLDPAVACLHPFSQASITAQHVTTYGLSRILIPGVNGNRILGALSPQAAGIINSGKPITYGTYANTNTIFIQLPNGIRTQGGTTIGAQGVTIPGGNFIATTGDHAVRDPVYTRALYLDTALKNWGSQDGQFRKIVDFVPINARSYNPTTQGSNTSFTFNNSAHSIIIQRHDGVLVLATQANNNSLISVGNLALTRTGMTRFTSALVAFVRDTGATVAIEGSLDGVNIDPRITSQVTSSNAIALLQKVLTAKWFRIIIQGEFNVKGVNATMEIGGKR